MRAKGCSPHLHQSTFSWGTLATLSGTAREHLTAQRLRGLVVTTRVWDRVPRRAMRWWLQGSLSPRSARAQEVIGTRHEPGGRQPGCRVRHERGELRQRETPPVADRPDRQWQVPRASVGERGEERLPHPVEACGQAGLQSRGGRCPFQGTSTGNPRPGESRGREASQTVWRSGGSGEAETRAPLIGSYLPEAQREGKEASSSLGITQTDNQVLTLSLCGGKYLELQEHPWGPAVP